MTDQPKRSRWKRRALIAFVVTFPVWYVLSYGPVNRYHASLPRPVEKTFEVFYWPLNKLREHSREVDMLVSAYVELWF